METSVTAYTSNGTTTTSLSTTTTTTTGEDLVPDNVKFYVDVVSIILLMSNLLNIVVFVKTGFKDCVSICLVSLTVSDFCITALLFAFGVLQGLITAGYSSYFDPGALLIYFGWFIAFFCDLTMFHTSFISLERCICVLFPFHFKNLITSQRAIVVLVCLYILSLVCYMPIFVSQSFSVQFDSDLNMTKIFVLYSANRRYLENVYNIYQTMVMNLLNLFTVTTCTVGMIVGLRRTSKFTTANASGGSDSGMSKKKLVLVKMVSILAIIYIACTCARSIVISPRLLDTAIAFNKQHHNLYMTLSVVYLMFGAINSSVNVFVYYHYKPIFKEHVLNIFSVSLEVNNVSTDH